MSEQQATSEDAHARAGAGTNGGGEDAGGGPGRGLAWASIALGVVYVVALAAALFYLPRWAPALLQLEHWTADWRTSLLSDRAESQHPGIAVIIVDEETLEDFPYRSPVDRGLLARLIAFADKAGARVIALDFIVDQATEPDKDAALLNAIRAARARIVLGGLDERVRLKPHQRSYQDAFLAKAGRPKGYLNLRYESDGVVRYAASPAPGSRYGQSFSHLAARLAGAADRLEPGHRIAWLLPPRDGTDTFTLLSGRSVLEAEKAPDGPLARSFRKLLAGKLVFIGAALSDKDRHRTPLSVSTGEGMPGVLVHAQIAAQLLDGRAIHHLRASGEWPVLLAVALIGFLLGWRYRLKRFDFLVGLFGTAVLIGLDSLVFSQFRVILPFTTPLLAWVLGVTGGSYTSMLFRRAA